MDTSNVDLVLFYSLPCRVYIMSFWMTVSFGLEQMYTTQQSVSVKIRNPGPTTHHLKHRIKLVTFS